MPSLLQPPCGLKFLELYKAPDTPASFDQNTGRFFQDRTGSRSGLKNKVVTSPRPRCVVTINGRSPEATSTVPSRCGPTATCISAVSNAASIGRLSNRLVAAGGVEPGSETRGAAP